MQTEDTGMQWYVSNEGSEPLGPLATDLVERGILAGKVPVTSLVCAVGDSRWMPLAAVPEFAEALREVAPPPDATPPPPPLPPPDTVQGASWWVRYPNQQAMGPYPGAAVLERLQSGVLLPTVEVCRVGDSAWTPAAQELGFAAAVAARVPRPDRGPDVSSWASVKQPSVVAATADPPVGVPPTIDVVVLTLCFLGALLVGLATVSVVPFGPPMVAALVYADAWIAGVRRRPEDRSLANMSPLGWAMAVVLGCGIALPFYALVRRKYRTRPGNPVLKVMVFIVALVPVCLLAALALWIVLPSGWQNGWATSTNPVSVALDPQAAGKREVFSDDESPECVIAKKRTAAVCEGSSRIAKDFGGRTPVSSEEWIDCYTRAKRIFIDNQVQTAPMGEAAKFAKCFR